MPAVQKSVVKQTLLVPAAVAAFCFLEQFVLPVPGCNGHTHGAFSAYGMGAKFLVHSGMNNRKTLLLPLVAAILILPSCSMLKPKYGCPSNGSNVGAERLLNDPPKKAKKFRA